MPDGVTGTSPTSSTTSAGATQSAKAGALDKEAFLKLLVAQLKFQNPLSPTDPSTFMAQSAQFAMVERLEQIGKAQTEAGTWQRVIAGQGLIGRQVTGSALGAPVAGLVTGLTVTKDGAVLELSTGGKLAVTDVQTVAATAPAATTSAATTRTATA